VCNDSGPMHIAAALGVPTVAVFGSGISRWFAPLGKDHRLVVREADLGESDADPRAHPYDVATITVEQIIAAVDDALTVFATE
jgi:heptosyltransferase-2